MRAYRARTSRRRGRRPSPASRSPPASSADPGVGRGAHHQSERPLRSTPAVVSAVARPRRTRRRRRRRRRRSWSRSSRSTGTELSTVPRPSPRCWPCGAEDRDRVGAGVVADRAFPAGGIAIGVELDHVAAGRASAGGAPATWTRKYTYWRSADTKPVAGPSAPPAAVRSRCVVAMSPASSVMGAAALATPTHRGWPAPETTGRRRTTRASPPHPARPPPSPSPRPDPGSGSPPCVPSSLTVSRSTHTCLRGRLGCESYPRTDRPGPRSGTGPEPLSCGLGQAVSAGVAGASTSSPIEDTRCFEM